MESGMGEGSRPYTRKFEQEFTNLINSLDLSDVQKQYLSSRWLEQVIWMESRANASQSRYYALRLVAIVGGVLVPALLGMRGIEALHWLAVGVSLVVAICVAVEEFFHYGERWRYYRRTVELLKGEGWRFFQLSGYYREFKSHGEALPTFAAQVEDIIQRDVEAYMTQVMKEKGEQSAGSAAPPANAQEVKLIQTTE